MELKGKNAIITGASRGIGKAIASRLVKQGVNVVLAARGQDALDETVRELQSQSKSKIIGLSTDVAKLDDLQKLADTAM